MDTYGITWTGEWVPVTLEMLCLCRYRHAFDVHPENAVAGILLRWLSLKNVGHREPNKTGKDAAGEAGPKTRSFLSRMTMLDER